MAENFVIYSTLHEAFMTDASFWFGDTTVSRVGAERPSPEAVVVFHGFPGEPPRGEEHKYAALPKRWIDLREAIFARLGMDGYSPRYEGLGGSRAPFSFTRSVTRSLDLARELAGRHRKVHVIGHSWGGLVAYNVHRELPQAGKLVLLSALVDLVSDAWIREFLPPYIRNYPQILGEDPAALERAAADMGEVLRRFNPATRAARGRPDARKTLVLHGTRDTYVDIGAARRLKERLDAHYIELDTDHSYTDSRATVVDAAVAFLADNA